MRLVALFLLSLQVCAKEIHLPIGPNSPQSSANTFTDVEAGFSVIIPDEWVYFSRSSDMAISVHSKHPNSQAFCAIYNRDHRGMHRSNEKYLEYLESSNTYFPDISRTLRAGRISVAGVYGYFREVASNESPLKAEYFNVYFMNNDIGYTIQCSANLGWYTQSLPVFGLFLSSFRFVNS